MIITLLVVLIYVPYIIGCKCRILCGVACAAISIQAIITTFVACPGGVRFYCVSCSGMQLGHYIDSTLLLCTHIVGRFLLVYIYTLHNGLSDRVLEWGVSGNVAELALFNA